MANSNMDPLSWLRNQLETADTDLLREMVTSFANQLMSAEVDALCGAGYGERTPNRENSAQRLPDAGLGHAGRQRGPGDPKLRTGTYFPDWLLVPRRRAERAMVAVVAECYLRGVSTRRVEGLVKTLGIERLSKSQVSEMAKSLDVMVADFRNRPLDRGPYIYVWLDAIVLRVREGGRIQNVSAVVATGVNVDGQREILGLDVVTGETGAAWTAFLRGLDARGLSGARLVISDDHAGLRPSIAAVLEGASWQRCRTHFMTNLLGRVPKSAQPMVATIVRSIFDQPDAAMVWE